MAGTSPDPIRTILVATDFSDASRAALEWAVSIAEPHGARIVLGHAMSPALRPGSVPPFLVLPPDYHEQVREACLRELDDLVSGVRSRGLEAEYQLETGVPAPTVLGWATKCEADLLVSGTRGLTGFKHVLLGSTAEQLVRGAACPMLTVRPDGAVRPREVRTVLIPTDFSEDAALATETALRVLGEPRPGQRIVLLHAYHLPVEFTPLAGRIPIGPALIAEACDEARTRLEPTAELLRGRGFEVDTIAREGYPPSVITEEAQTAHADLIAMGTHGRSGLKHALIGSTAERVVQHAPCPVLTVRRVSA
ncbi:MAG: universal stress protein [Deltaproteobacteria bacterium]|nr:MAG: universal stress protein [Deltaproteobacteria bacterium]